jgi:3-hydroxyacyl-CoA dehydrogenase
MIERGLIGRKGKGGFYRMQGRGATRTMEAIDLTTGEYRPTREARLASLDAAKAAGKGAGLRTLVEHGDRGGVYAWKMLSQTLAYAASLVPAIADEIAAVDEAMKTGYSWEYGPFELIDRLGPAYLAARLEREGRPVPPLLRLVGDGTFYRVSDGRLQQLLPGGGHADGAAGRYVDVVRPDGVLLLADVKRAAEPVARNGSASYWDIGDGVLCLEFHTKMNALDDGIVQMVARAPELVDGRRYRALVIYNEGTNFSVGANIGVALFAANLAMWPQIEASTRGGQRAFRALTHAPFPTVAAPHGMALGGGCEIVLACPAAQAHAETYLGLVEVGVGVVPGWGGIRELLVRWSTHPKRPGGPMPPVAKAFELISTGYVSTSAEEAREALFLRPTDGVTMNRDRLLADAKARALAMLAAGYEPPEPVELSLPGPSGRAALEMAVDGFVQSGKATPHDAVVAKRLAVALTGGDTDVTEKTSEERLDELATEAFMDLVRTEPTLARIEHMLATGKPLRN